MVRQAFALRFLDGPPRKKGGVKPPRGVVVGEREATEAAETVSGALAQPEVEDRGKRGEVVASTRRESEAAGISAPVSRRGTVSLEPSSELARGPS